MQLETAFKSEPRAAPTGGEKTIWNFIGGEVARWCGGAGGEVARYLWFMCDIRREVGTTREMHTRREDHCRSLATHSQTAPLPAEPAVPAAVKQYT